MDCAHIREVVSSAYPERLFIFLRESESVKVKILDLPTPVAQNFESLVPLQIFALLSLRERLVFSVSHAIGIVYLARENVKGMAGQHRRIVNVSQAYDFFRLNHGDIDDFSGKSLSEKLELASRYRNSFTPNWRELDKLHIHSE
jgi:hypothetical protein